LGCIWGDSSSMFAACTFLVHCTTVSQPGTFFKQFDRFGFVLSTPLSTGTTTTQATQGQDCFSVHLIWRTIHEL
jgi:hypothetical protein